jgi:alpha-glucosidase (family GH31 glycosyl hydrolase)
MIQKLTLPVLLLILTIEAYAGEAMRIEDTNYAVEINTDGFKFHFSDSEGVVVAPPHATAGMLINDEPVVSVTLGKNNQLAARTAASVTVDITTSLQNGVVTVTVVPRKDSRHKIRLRMGGMPVAHGLGDAGGWNDTFNLVGEKVKHFDIINNGGKQRWASSFVIFPHNSLAGVALGDDTQSVTLSPNEYGMEVTKSGPIVFHYFLGDMPSIYKSYLDVRLQSGYPNVKPKFRLFELGWESWAALGWRANAQTVQEAIGKLQDDGFPVRWAVTGSGFWTQGGTTTNFGQYGEKFPNPKSFRKWLNDQNVKWMIGLRTNFVPSGGPYVPESSKRDRNLKGDSYDGNPISDVLLKQGYLLKDAKGKPVKVTSQWFPQIPCYLLDGRNPAAARWFADHYKKWEVDGIKEDTMMGTNIGIFDGPIGTIAKEGALVMARCGSFSSPGTLLRINDTAGARDMAKRIPINYLQYAACGAPNPYSDTIGFRNNDESVENLRHGWLMSCTAGQAIGPFNWKQPEMVKAFKRMIMFHYEIGPTKYDAAMKSYQSGYPYTMTPLSIAYPDDPAAASTPSFQWMIGESLLAAPLVKNVGSNALDVYLPQGTWYDYDSGKAYEGPTTLKNCPMLLDKTPCFVGGKGVIVTRSSDDEPLTAKIYPIAEDNTFTFNHPDGESRSVITIGKWKEIPVVKDVTSEHEIPVVLCKKSGAVSFKIRPDHHYQLGLNLD